MTRRSLTRASARASQAPRARSARAEQALRTVIAESTEPLWLLGADGRVAVANAAAARLTGHVPAALAGVRFATLHFAGDEPAGPRVAGDDGDGLRLRLRHPSGGAIPVDLHRTKLDDGRVLLRARAPDRPPQNGPLHDQPAWLWHLFDTIPDLVWLKDPDGVYLTCNRAFTEFYGQPVADIVGKTDYDLIERERAEFYRSRDREAIALGQTLSNVTSFTYADGRTRRVEVIKRPMYDPQGTLLGVLGVGRDVTESYAARESLEEKLRLRTQLERLAAAAPDVICSFRLKPDGTGCFPYASPAFVDLYGIPPEAVRDDASILRPRTHPADLAAGDAALAESLRTLTAWRSQFRIRHPTRGEVWIEGHLAPQAEPDGSFLWHGFLRDITEQKRAEQALARESELRRTLVEKATEGIAVVDPDLRFVDANPRFAETLGYTREELLALHVWDVDLRWTREQLLAQFGGPTRPEANFETRHRRKDGTELEVEITVFPAETEAGVMRFVIARDITQRRATERRNRQLASLVHHSEDFVGIADIGGRVQFLNPFARHLVGLSPEDTVAGRSIPGFVHPSEQARLAREIMPALAGPGHWSGELALVDAGGDAVPTLTQAFRIDDLDGQPLAFATVCRDIRELKRVDEELRRLNRIHATLSQTNEAIVRAGSEAELFARVCDIAALDGGFAVAWIGLLGGDGFLRSVASAGPARAFVDELIVSSDERRAEGRGISGEALRSGRRAIRNDVASVPGLRPWSERARQFGIRSGAALPLFRAGEVIGLLSVYSTQSGHFGEREVSLLEDMAADLSFGLESLARAEALTSSLGELRRAREELEQRVRERTAALAAANRELETFAYSVSHDLKAPLRAIDGYSQLLLADHAAKLDDEGREFLTRVRRGVTDMKTLIDDLLEYSRSERRALQRARVDLAALVDDVVKGLAEAIASAGAVMIVALPPASLLADPEGVAQVVRNLVENALKFSRGQAPPRVEIGARVDGASCTLSVRDNGVGFDMQYHERIFEIFQRLHRAEDYPGTGIGLALVHKAVSRMGGRVWAESAPGHGATFFVELPLAAAVPSAPGGAA